MSQSGRVRIVLDIEEQAQPITGTLTDRSGRDRAFCGWTALAAAIDRALEPDEPLAKEDR